ncbi:MAG: hypothetical protein RL223_4229, partial [Pseudomonadota bacterium]
ASSHSHAQRERLAYIELRTWFTGELRRADIESRFGIRPAASSRDLTAYRELAPDNLDYDSVGRCYRPGSKFQPVFPLEPERVLTWLSHGFGDGLAVAGRLAPPCEVARPLVRPDLNRLAALSRAICQQQGVAVRYLSPLSGPSSREIVPLALADNGLRWHLRAYDRQRARFIDLVLTRIIDVSALAQTIADHERLAADEQWQRQLTLELVPHPGLPWPAAIAADYGLHDGVLRLAARAAMAGYLLRRWSVDCSPDHTLEPRSHPLWLRNAEVLSNVDSAILAPGHAVTGRDDHAPV